jgi:CNT family concentrative nucleoside transporter
MDILRGILGVGILVGITYLFSTDKKNIDWALVGKGLLMQLVIALLMLKVPFVYNAVKLVVDFFVMMIASSETAAQFMFGSLADKTVAGYPGSPVSTMANQAIDAGTLDPEAAEGLKATFGRFGFGFAFFVLPTIIFFSALSSLLYYYGILQKVVYAFAWVMRKFMRLSGAESLAAAANVFIGQTEAPLVVKPYLERMTKSEILCLMTGGMATIAGGVFGAYMGMLGGSDPEELTKFGTHLLTASIISAPAAIIAAKILFPETDFENTNQELKIPKTELGSNPLDALSRGTSDGLKLAFNVGAMIISFMALVYLANSILGAFGDFTGLNGIIAANTDYDSLSMQLIMGYIFAPIAWVIGVSGDDVLHMGRLLGEKTILNEFIAYDSLARIKPELSEKTVIIATYALCGFANIGSIGIQIGGIGGLAPGQRETLSRFGFQALVGGTVACLLTACIAGMLVW